MILTILDNERKIFHHMGFHMAVGLDHFQKFFLSINCTSYKHKAQV